MVRAANPTKLRVLVLVLFGIVMISFSTSQVFAHSGRTDSSGGHNCYVGSCAGTYHYHNGGGGYTAPSTPDYYSQGIDNGKAHAVRETASIQSKSNTSGYQAGYQAGSAGNARSTYLMVPSNVCNITFTFTAGTTETYKSGYDSGWDSQCGIIADTTYKSSYERGYIEGAKVKASTPTKAAASNSASKNDDSGGLGDWWWVIGLGGLYATVAAYEWLSDKSKS